VGNKKHILAGIVLMLWASVPMAQDFAAAVVRSERHTTLSAQRDGVIRGLTLQLGDKVQQGQIIAQFDCEELSAQQNAADAKLRRAELDLAIQKRLFDRGAAGEGSVLKLQASVDETHAMAAVQAARLGRCYISAPFSGEVAARLVQPHSYVKVGDPVIELADPSALYIEGIIPAIWLSYVSQGDRVMFQPEGSEQQFDAQLTRIGSIIDAVSQTINVHATFTNSSAEIIPGQSGHLIFAFTN
jgi:RND family efflux transporter MFP subunit